MKGWMDEESIWDNCVCEWMNEWMNRWIVCQNKCMGILWMNIHMNKCDYFKDE